MLKDLNDCFVLQRETIDLSRPLKSADILIPGDNILVRIGASLVTVHYLLSSDQILIPSEYMNFFSWASREIRRREEENIITLGIDFYLALWKKTSIHPILARMIKLGTQDLRRWIGDDKLEPWTLRNIHNTLEI